MGYLASQASERALSFSLAPLGRNLHIAAGAGRPAAGCRRRLYRGATAAVRRRRSRRALAAADASGLSDNGALPDAGAAWRTAERAAGAGAASSSASAVARSWRPVPAAPMLGRRVQALYAALPRVAMFPARRRQPLDPMDRDCANLLRFGSNHAAAHWQLLLWLRQDNWLSACRSVAPRGRPAFACPRSFTRSVMSLFACESLPAGAGTILFGPASAFMTGGGWENPTNQTVCDNRRRRPCRPRPTQPRRRSP